MIGIDRGIIWFSLAVPADGRVQMDGRLQLVVQNARVCLPRRQSTQLVVVPYRRQSTRKRGSCTAKA
jgi:hypothetical protein